MKAIGIHFSQEELNSASKEKLKEIVIRQSQKLKELERETQLIREKLKKVERENENLKKEVDQKKTGKVNSESNKPSSKKPEWDKDGNPKQGKKAKPGGKRKGAGNKSKNREPNQINCNALDECPDCGADLSDQPVLGTQSRVVEDISDPPEESYVSEEIQEKKWCPNCQKVVWSRSEKALCGSDFGLNALVLSAYLWVVMGTSLPGIKNLLSRFMQLSLSSSGLVKMMIRLSQILEPVYEEIRKEVKDGVQIWADETGWRIKGNLHWLWAFANQNSAYYWMDRSRGSPVVEKILGSMFYGVLITDAWCAYSKIACSKQTCMVHIFRKIRGFIDEYPEYRSIMSFYIKLRRIIRDAQTLQGCRKELGDLVFYRRLKLLHLRLSNLLNWHNPNPVLNSIIQKVKRQQEFILTFAEHEGVPHHNNFAEYIIKMGVLKRKVSGGSMSLEGAKAYAILLSIAQTCHLRKISFHKYLRESLIRYIRTGRPLLLSEYETINLKIAA